MTCPICGSATRVMDSRSDCDAVYRRRRCVNIECGHLFYTTEVETDGEELKSISRKIMKDRRRIK